MNRSIEVKDAEDEPELYCICRSSDATRFMICCDECNEWYHGDCINISQDKANDIENFYCHDCLVVKPNLKIVYKKHVKIIKMKERLHKEKININERCGKCKGCIKMFDCGKCDICMEKIKEGSMEKTHKRCRERECQLKKFGKNLEKLKKKSLHDNPFKSHSHHHNTSILEKYKKINDKGLSISNKRKDDAEENGIKYPKILKPNRLFEPEDSLSERPLSRVSDVKTETCYEKDLAIGSSKLDGVSTNSLEHEIPKKSHITSYQTEPQKSKTKDKIKGRVSPNLSSNTPEDDTSDDPDFHDENSNKAMDQRLKQSKSLRTPSNVEEKLNSFNNAPKKSLPSGITHAGNVNVRSSATHKAIGSHGHYPPQQCHGPKCVKTNRPGSKYCSDECGLKLATKRIFEFLPMRIQQWQNNPTISDFKNKAQWDKVRAKQIASQNKLEQLNHEREALERLIAHGKGLSIDPDQDNQESEVEETETSIFCVTCGHPINPKTAPRHMDKCFSKVESQTSYGSIYKTNVGMDLFCDAYNAESQTYCKRLKVLCPEHTKDPKINDNEVCGCPLTTNVFQETGEFCRASKKRCMRHYNWEKIRRAQIDMEKVRQLLILDDLFEEERQIRLQLSRRSGVLGLILHQTIAYNNPTVLNAKIMANTT